jgi:hypothetical protein
MYTRVSKGYWPLGVGCWQNTLMPDAVPDYEFVLVLPMAKGQKPTAVEIVALC